MSKKKKTRNTPNKRKKGWNRTERGRNRKSRSPVPPLRNNADGDNSNLQEHLLSPSAVSPVVRPSPRIKSTLQQVARSNTRLQSVKFKLTDSNASLNAELEQVRRE